MNCTWHYISTAACFAGGGTLAILFIFFHLPLLSEAPHRDDPFVWLRAACSCLWKKPTVFLGQLEKSALPQLQGCAAPPMLGLRAQKTQASPRVSAEVQNISAGYKASAPLLQAIQHTKTIIFKDFLLHIWNHCLLFTCLHRHLQFFIMKEEWLAGTFQLIGLYCAVDGMHENWMFPDFY